VAQALLLALRNEGFTRAHLPRFAGANFDRNTGMLTSFNAVAQEKGVTPSQLAILLAGGDQIVPLVGSPQTHPINRSPSARSPYG
jgi:aryl-alcohol dehydrogenase-like predicted oxidoreductase